MSFGDSGPKYSGDYRLFNEMERHQAAFTKAKKNLDELRPQIDDRFNDVISEDRRDLDRERVEHVQQGFRRRDTAFESRQAERSLILEAVITEHIELSAWLGLDVETTPTSDFDDAFHGIDLAVNMPGVDADDQSLFGIDITYSPENLKKKIVRWIERNSLGSGGEIRYLDLPGSSLLGPQESVPVFALFVHEKEAAQLRDLWMEGKKKALGSHPIQFVIFEQLLLQLNVYRSVAENNNRTELVARYNTLERKLIGSIDFERFDEAARAYLEQHGELSEMKTAFREQLPTTIANKFVSKKNSGIVLRLLAATNAAEMASAIQDMAQAEPLVNDSTGDLLATPVIWVSHDDILADAVTRSLGELDVQFAIDRALYAAHLAGEHPENAVRLDDAKVEYGAALAARIKSAIEELHRNFLTEKTETSAISPSELASQMCAEGIKIGQPTVLRIARMLQKSPEDLTTYRGQNNRDWIRLSASLAQDIRYWTLTHRLASNGTLEVRPYAPGWISREELLTRHPVEYRNQLIGLWDDLETECMRFPDGHVYPVCSSDDADRATGVIDQRKNILLPQPGEVTVMDIADHYNAPESSVRSILKRKQGSADHEFTRNLRRINSDQQTTAWYYSAQAIKALSGELAKYKELFTPHPEERSASEIAEELSKVLNITLYNATIGKTAKKLEISGSLRLRRVPPRSTVVYYSSTEIARIEASIRDFYAIPAAKTAHLTRGDLIYVLRQTYGLTLADAQGAITWAEHQLTESVVVRRHPVSGVRLQYYDRNILVNIETHIEKDLVIPKAWLSVADLAGRFKLTSAGRLTGGLRAIATERNPDKVRRKGGTYYFNPSALEIVAYITEQESKAAVREAVETGKSVYGMDYVRANIDRYPFLTGAMINRLIQRAHSVIPLSMAASKVRSGIALTAEGVAYLDQLLADHRIPSTWVSLSDAAARAKVGKQLFSKWLGKHNANGQMSTTEIASRELFIHPSLVDELITSYRERETAADRIPADWVSVEELAQQEQMTKLNASLLMRGLVFWRPDGLHSTRIRGATTHFYAPDFISSAKIIRNSKDTLITSKKIPRDWMAVEDIAELLSASKNDIYTILRVIKATENPEYVRDEKGDRGQRHKYYYSQAVVKCIRRQFAVNEKIDAKKQEYALYVVLPSELQLLRQTVSSTIVKLRNDPSAERGREVKLVLFFELLRGQVDRPVILGQVEYLELLELLQEKT